MTESSPTANWHAMPAQAALASLNTTPEGLGTVEVSSRRKEFGPNRLTPPPSRSALRRFLAQFNNVLIYVLLAAGCVTVALGHHVDAGVIFGVVLINGVIGFIQEGKAERALDAVRSLLSPQATVVREGHRTTVPADQLVPGDIVFMQSGDRVPADVRLLKLREMHVDEAKHPDPVHADASLATGAIWPTPARWSLRARQPPWLRQPATARKSAGSARCSRRLSP